LQVIDKYTTEELSKLTGLSVSMVGYLCDNGVVKPIVDNERKRGKRRYFKFYDVVWLRTVNGLLSSGLSVKRLKKCMINLRRDCSKITLESNPYKYLTTDGVTLYFTENSNPLDLLNGAQFAFTFMVDIAKIHLEMQVAARQLRRIKTASR
jgi:DNA-binding transcriptional MerR regulator